MYRENYVSHKNKFWKCGWKTFTYSKNLETEIEIIATELAIFFVPLVCILSTKLLRAIFFLSMKMTAPEFRRKCSSNTGL